MDETPDGRYTINTNYHRLSSVVNIAIKKAAALQRGFFY
jgi:hypothetical protein